MKLKLNSSLRCIEIRMHNVGVKNVSDEGNIGRVQATSVEVEKRTLQEEEERGRKWIIINKLIKQW